MGGPGRFYKIAQRKKKSLNIYVNCVLMHIMPSRESTRKPRESIEALNMDSRSGLSSVKLMEETDIAVQIFSFLKVTAVRYNEKPDKDGQTCHGYP